MSTWLVDRDWGVALAEARGLYGGALRIVCPFIKVRPIVQLVGGTPPKPFDVLTRFNLADFGSGVSDVAALRAILEAGGRVRGVRGLHAKLFMFDDARAAVTSANLTNWGLNRNHEFGCVSENRSFIEACRTYFDRMWQAADGSDLTLAQLDAWDGQVAAFLASGGRPEVEAGLPDYGAVVGGGVVVGDDPLATVTARGWLPESGEAFVKFFGRSDDRLPWSFVAFDEVRRAGCHWACTYPIGRRPRQVADGDTLFTARLVKNPNDTLIFGRAIGMAYIDGRDDATQADIDARPWKAQWPHYIRVHHGEFVAGTLANGVRLSELMSVLGPDAFASTQDNQRRGIGNLNPRVAVRQHPAVRLTSEGSAWLTEKLDHAFAIHGCVPAEQLASLDWPT